MRRGDVCLAHYPFTDDIAAKIRPIVVISADTANQGDDVIVLPFSTRPEPDDPHAIYLDASSPHFRASGLRFPSAIKWSKPMVISKTVITRRLGRLDQSILSAACQNLCGIIS